jgi:predicted deacetylase
VTAKYLLRFDDLCPTMNWDVWREVEDILRNADVKPILAVVPDNRDEKLQCGDPNSSFWEHVRRWQNLGAAIGLHGHQHRYLTRDSGIIGLNNRSEFAGLPIVEQETKLRSALEIFRREEVRPSVWVAPAHSFDESTVTVLVQLGIRVISDGFFLFPHVDRKGTMWIPQQLWRFRTMPFGVWTICLHHNAWTKEDVSLFRQDLRRYKHAILSVPDVIEAYRERNPGVIDMLVARSILGSIRMKRRLRRRSA